MISPDRPPIGDRKLFLPKIPLSSLPPLPYAFALEELFQFVDFIEDPAVRKMRLLRLLPPSKNITDRK